MKKINILDSNFSHCKYVVENSIPKLMDWERDNFNSKSHVILTDNELTKIDKIKKQFDVVIGWLIEPKAINPEIYSFMKCNYDKFNYVLTFDKELISLNPDKIKFCPYGTTWIKENDFINPATGFNNKTKDISMIMSFKAKTEGHKLRNEIYNKYFTSNKIDFYGRNIVPITNKISGLKNYRASITVENSSSDYYFTEKLIDCFLSGTIPIYYGPESIHKFFNINGIIQFKSIKELDNIINNFNFEYEYKARINALIENYNMALEYANLEDYMYKNLLKTIIK